MYVLVQWQTFQFKVQNIILLGVKNGKLNGNNNLYRNLELFFKFIIFLLTVNTSYPRENMQ